MGLSHICLLETYLDLLQWEGGFSILQIKCEEKIFPAELFPPLQTIFLYPLSHVAKNPLVLDRLDHRSITVLRIFSCRFGDNMNTSLPFLRPIFESLVFRFVIPYVATNITCAGANLKPMMRAKQFPCFEIVRMQDHISFSGIGVIPLHRAVSF